MFSSKEIDHLSIIYSVYFTRELNSKAAAFLSSPPLQSFPKPPFLAPGILLYVAFLGLKTVLDAFAHDCMLHMLWPHSDDLTVIVKTRSPRLTCAFKPFSLVQCHIVSFIHLLHDGTLGEIKRTRQRRVRYGSCFRELRV